jgi:prepilin-type N-terminal cleavage/methylation domain-containing protein
MMKWLRNQKGMTLLEVTVGIAIAGLIGVCVLGLIVHEIKSTAATRACVTAAVEIDNAARWVSQDGMMAEVTNLTESAQPVDSLSLTWVERQEFIDVPHTCSYSLAGGELRRDYDGIVTTVARHISDIKFSQTGKMITVSITCTPPWVGQSRIVERTYRIYRRVAEGG